jgi:two-component sensor histidine kinase
VIVDQGSLRVRDREYLAVFNILLHRRRVAQRLAPVPESIPVGRWIAVRACHEWGLAAIATPAGQIVTELVGNAVQHAGTPIDLVLTYSRSRNLHIAVRDGCPRLPRPRTPESVEDHGRGLLVVEALADEYGAVPTHDGKVVWASLSARSSR